MKLQISALARRDIKKILGYSRRSYGAEAMARYSELLTAAMLDVTKNPMLLGSHGVKDMPDIRAYPIAHSTGGIAAAVRVQNPAHKLIYKLFPGGMTVIVSVVGMSYPAELALKPARP